MTVKKISAKKLFEKNRRFDLIYKILFLESLSKTNQEKQYAQELYEKSIYYFNGYYEDYPCKTSKEDFTEAFLKCYNNMAEYGFDDMYPIPVNSNMQLYDGAHRLACAYVLNKDVLIDYKQHNCNFNYNFFRKRKMPVKLMDIGAYEYILRNENAHMVEVFPIAGVRNIKTIERILNKYGFVYYKKSVFLTTDAILRIKNINYGAEEWIGNRTNNYSGLRNHALRCVAPGKTTFFILCCDDESAVKAKAEVREYLGKGNYPIHINDSHEEAISIAKLIFNNNAVDWLNSVPFIHYEYENKIQSEIIAYMKKYKLSNNDICVSGSAVMAMYGLREPKDIDCITRSHINMIDEGNVSNHETEKRYYPTDFNDLIIRQDNSFIIDNVRYLSLNNILKMKVNRHEFIKDYYDIFLMIVKKNANKTRLFLKTILLDSAIGLIYVCKETIRNGKRI